MIDYNILGFILVSVVALLGFGGVISQMRHPFPLRLVLLAIVARIVGSTARYEVLYRFYGGVGDAVGYYGDGVAFADRLWAGDLSVFSWEQWFGGRWWGTNVVDNIAGLVISVTGPTMRGGFLAFSLLAFIGLYCIALAFARTCPNRSAVRFATWIWFFPSLLFWPSSMGKEAVIMLGIGVITLGYVGRQSRVRWGLVILGTTLVFFVRPHVAAAAMLAAGIAHWLGSWERVGIRRVVEAIVMVVIVLVTLDRMRVAFGLSNADLEGVQEFISFRARQTMQGGSSLETLPSGPLGIVVSFVNIWMRPFLWEAHNATALLSAFEGTLLWGLVAYRFKSLKNGLAGWRQNRFLRFGMPLLFGYTVMLGMNFGNLGIIARQRSLVFPFFFGMLALPGDRASARTAGRRAAVAAGRQRLRHRDARSPGQGSDRGRREPSPARSSDRTPLSRPSAGNREPSAPRFPTPDPDPGSA